ncbi:preprotein translocase subunit SecY [Salibacter halophilus]|uniref:Protein translocase subunit SecY n=1 Tax=Salibacter halophilus TaxID=1803916 RepID=A0A6N6MCH1_9FLAO|nr:preprotein translocase subunit SecY [Salibacter halophilus]KAB1066223.1 preprotein translocase subunit SecY [Salibacter halophilus]
MKRLFDTIANIFKIEELRDRILLTLGLILVYRLGSFVVLPGVDPIVLEEASEGATGLAALLNIFAGGAFSRASVFALGIMPYISASIIMQLLGIAVPAVQKMQKEGESGRRKINQYTRFLTIAITAGQAPGYLATQVPDAAVVDPGFMSFTLPSIVILTAGTLFVMWLGEKITDRGIGNGISLIIMIGIIAGLPTAFLFEFDKQMGDGGGGLVIILIEVLILLVVILLTVLLVQGVRRVPVNFARKVAGGQQQAQGARQYIPLKVNASGVMPIIFAQALMMIPITLVNFSQSEELAGWASLFNDISGFWYNFIFAVMIILFTYFYTAITINPQQMADDLKKNNGFIPGVRPGQDTSNFLDNVLSRITLPGAIFLAFIAILPAFAINAGVSNNFALFFGGTSLLIMVGVVLDTLQQIESYLLMRHYDGLMKSGKLKGRASAFGMAG